jgi:hypothetical protein
MGKHTETVAVGVGGKDSQFRSCEKAHYVGRRAQENRSSSKSTVGEG